MIRKCMISACLVLTSLAAPLMGRAGSQDVQGPAPSLAPPAPLESSSITAGPVPGLSADNETAEDIFSKARGYYESGDYESAASSALETARLFPGTAWEGRSVFLAARAYAEQRDADAASSLFSLAVMKYPVLADYSMYTLAGLYSELSRHEDASAAYKALAREYPDSPLASESVLDGAEADIELGRYTDAVSGLKAFQAMKANGAQSAKAVYLLMKAYEGLGDPASAAGQYRTLLLDYPESAQSARAEKEAGRLIEAGALLPAFGYGDYLKRAERFRGLEMHKAASEEYRAALRLIPEGTPVRAGTLLKLGESCYRSRQDSAAEAALFDAIEASQDPGESAEALYWLTRTYLRTGEGDGFEAAALSCASSYPDDPRALDCLYLLGVEYGYEGRYVESAGLFNGLLGRYPASRRRDELLWQYGWASYKAGYYAEAEAAFGRLAQEYPGTELAPRGLYWQAKSLEKMGLPERADATNERLAGDYGLSFHGFLARHGADALTTIAAGTPAGLSFPAVEDAYADRALARALELGMQGMKREGVRELKRADGRYASDLEGLKTVAGIYGFLGEYRRPLMLASNMYSGPLSSGRASVPDDALRMVFPAGYWEVISREAGAFGVDPFLVCAIIWEESRYDQSAVSPAGAVGLMQLMPGTAKAMCRKLGIRDATASQLMEGGFNVPLGTCYLASLIERHKGRLPYVLAEYNAGPAALARWIDRAADAADDEFIEGISYFQTRQYVKRVLRNYNIYRTLYGTGKAGVRE